MDCGLSASADSSRSSCSRAPVASSRGGGGSAAASASACRLPRPLPRGEERVVGAGITQLRVTACRGEGRGFRRGSQLGPAAARLRGSGEGCSRGSGAGARFLIFCSSCHSTTPTARKRRNTWEMGGELDRWAAGSPATRAEAGAARAERKRRRAEHAATWASHAGWPRGKCASVTSATGE